MLVLNVKEMQEFEEFTLNQLELSQTDLMFRAGYMLVKDFISRLKPKFDVDITIFAGVGNNGGDALVMASELDKLGYQIRLFIVGDIAKSSESFKFYLEKNTTYELIDSQNGLDILIDQISNSKVIIDGIFGIGLSRRIDGYTKDLIDCINTLDAIVYSVDIPSGLHPERGVPYPIAINASLTGIVGHYKLGNILADALDYQGETNVLDIGIIQAYNVDRRYLDVLSKHLELPTLKHNINKYTKGAGCFFGGSDAFMGSIQMTAYSAMKCGLGIAFINTKTAMPITQFYPELVIYDIRKVDYSKFIDKAKVIVFGPGLEEDDPEYQKIFVDILNRKLPIVIDATGLNYLDINKDYHDNSIIITPHVGELARLFSVDSETILENPIIIVTKERRERKRIYG